MQMKICFPGGSRVDAVYDGFTIPTDQPVRLGGACEAPAPFDYFLASIGTCAGYFVLRFLQARGMPTESVGLELETVRDPENHMVTEIGIRVLLPGGFPERYRNAILKSVDLCSVQRHLQQPPAIRTTVRIGGRAAA